MFTELGTRVSASTPVFRSSYASARPNESTNALEAPYNTTYGEPENAGERREQDDAAAATIAEPSAEGVCEVDIGADVRLELVVELLDVAIEEPPVARAAEVVADHEADVGVARRRVEIGYRGTIGHVERDGLTTRPVDPRMLSAVALSRFSSMSVSARSKPRACSARWRIRLRFRPLHP